MKAQNTIDIISLGCSKNLVDSEKLMLQLQANGFKVTHDPIVSKGKIVIINTCGFIGDAKEESINMILEFAEKKQKGEINKLIVTGCLSGRYADELAKEIPEVDAYYGKFAWKEIISDLGKSYQQDLQFERTLTSPSHYAYLKIAEGCNHGCSYCAIPIITGAYQSVPMEDIVEEVTRLVSHGVKEFQVIAQDVTYYGRDLYKKAMLPELVERISEVKGVEWIRLHYAYPTLFPMDLLRVMREKENVCKYLDIAFQHISDPVLKAMRRNTSAEETVQLIETIRRAVPGIHLRTTLIAGHPGETEEDFQQLMEFVRTSRFERMGTFAYSEEEGTYSAEHYKDDVSEEVKQQRVDQLMALQQRISSEVNAAKIGQTMKVIIDREEEEYYIGRTEFDSPEVDPEVLITKDKPLHIGDFYSVLITDSESFELYGTVVKATKSPKTTKTTKTATVEIPSKAAKPQK